MKTKNISPYILQISAHSMNRLHLSCAGSDVSLASRSLFPQPTSVGFASPEPQGNICIFKKEKSVMLVNVSVDTGSEEAFSPHNRAQAKTNSIALLYTNSPLPSARESRCAVSFVWF